MLHNSPHFGMLSMNKFRLHIFQKTSTQVMLCQQMHISADISVIQTSHVVSAILCICGYIDLFKKSQKLVVALELKVAFDLWANGPQIWKEPMKAWQFMVCLCFNLLHTVFLSTLLSKGFHHSLAQE